MPGRLGVVVVNYGSSGLLAQHLPRVASDGTAIVVVDNLSSAAERDAVRALCAERDWILHEEPGNAGFGAGANAGVAAARAAGCDAFVLLNPDAVVTPDDLAALATHVRRRRLELVAPVIEDSTGRRVFQGVELVVRTGRMRRHDGRSIGEPVELWLTGACLAVHADAWDRVGGFDDSYFLYWEDVDLSVRAVRAGCTLAIRDDVVVRHDEGGTQGRQAADRAKSSVYYYFNCRNRLVFAARLLPRGLRWRWLAATPGASWEILMRGGKRQLLASRAPLWATLRGTVSGVREVLRSLVRG